jgi:transcriptional regulator with XRE-family HTH domain
VEVLEMVVEDKKPNDKLRYQRELRGWSQKKVGQAIGTNKDMVSRWETGERETSPYYREKLCTLFGMSAAELGFITHANSEDATSPVTPQAQEVLSLLTTAVSLGIIMAVRDLERTTMDPSKRDFLRLLGTSLALTGTITHESTSTLHSILNGDRLAVYEQEIAKRWTIYHQGKTLQALDGLGLWIKEVENIAKELTGLQRTNAYSLVSLSYQLQGSLHRDRMDYNQAHNAYKKAFIAADEFDNPELKSSSLARRGVTFIQQHQPIYAIQYLESALLSLDPQDHPYLRGYIYQALSEAHAMAHHASESWEHTDLATEALTYKSNAIESSNCSSNTTSVTAQKGVNAVLLKDYKQALSLLNTGINQYSPRLQRGRARLIAQKAEAYFGLGQIDGCIEAAKMAYNIARSIGSEKTISRVKNLNLSLQKLPYRKEQCVVQLGMMLDEKE